MMNPYMAPGLMSLWGLGVSPLFWALVALVVVIARADRPQDATARRVLDERFARGEIDAEEYKSHRSLMVGH